MSGNTFGKLFAVTNFGESHGPAIGCVIDGCPPGMDLAEADIQPDLDRRKPGTSRHVTQRKEEDKVEILSGVYEGKTSGTPIALLIRNEDARSKDYAKIAASFRPGHADYTYQHKYGLRDYRGGGRSSARETVMRVAAGAIARKYLAERLGVRITGYLSQIGTLQLDPVDLRGLPRIAADQTEWVPPKFLPTSGKGILFLDELTSAPQMTQAGCYQLVLDRKLGEYTLPDGWVVIAAGNPASERGVHFAMPRPLRNRFVHLDLEPDLDDWCRWAVKAQVRPEIIAFLRFKPELLHTADATSDANAWPTPRSWEMASQVLCGIARRHKTQLLAGTSEFEAQLLDGTVGPAAASELVAFLRLFRQLPSIDEILLNPATATVPAEPSAQIAIATALGRVLSDSSVGRGLTYLDRMPTEMRVMAVRDAAARDTAITHTPEFVRFGVEYREVIQ